MIDNVCRHRLHTRQGHLTWLPDLPNTWSVISRMNLRLYEGCNHGSTLHTSVPTRARARSGCAPIVMLSSWVKSRGSKVVTQEADKLARVN